MKTAVVLMNLGTPSAPTKSAVRKFLREFLSDPRVVEVPALVWWFVLNLVIIPLRAGRVARAYQSIWQDSGSPLRSITESQQKKLALLLQEKLGERAPIVRHAMTYSGPDLDSVVAKLQSEGVDRIVILPLYPQYSATTTGSVYDRVASIFKSRRNIPELIVVKQYFEHPLYIEALAQSVRSHWQQAGRSDRLLMSFHSIPQRCCDEGDPYYDQCLVTASALAEALALKPDEWAVSFQSRVGYAQWLSPYTIDVVEQWGREKLGSVDVMCPAFSADCLETLEEIEVENRHVFLQAGGGEFKRIDCLNDSDDHIKLLAELVEIHLPKA